MNSNYAVAFDPDEDVEKPHVRQDGGSVVRSLSLSLHLVTS